MSCPLFAAVFAEACGLAADCHSAQGDAEISGTAIETSLTAVYRLTTLPQATLPAALQNLRSAQAAFLCNSDSVSC